MTELNTPNKWDGGEAEGRALLAALKDAEPGLVPTAHALAVLDDLAREAEAGGESELAARIRATRTDPARLRAFRAELAKTQASAAPTPAPPG